MARFKSIPFREIQRTRDSLLSHLAQIRRLLDDPNRDVTNAHIFLAGSLRVLLCDKNPILLRYAEHFKIKLRIWSPNPPGFIPDQKMILNINFNVASFAKDDVMHEMSINQYLQTQLGVANFTHYTPYQLIKWVANKEGAAHLQSSPQSELEDIKNTFGVYVPVPGMKATDGYVVRNAILQISSWTASAIEHVLSHDNEQGKVVGAA